MKTTYEYDIVYTSCFQLIFISSPRWLMKSAYMKTIELDFIFCFMIEKGYI